MTSTAEKAPKSSSTESKPPDYATLVKYIEGGQQRIANAIAKNPQQQDELIKNYAGRLNASLSVINGYNLPSDTAAAYKAIVLAEQNRVMLAAMPKMKISRLRNVQTLCQWQQERVSLILEVNKKLSLPEARQVLSYLWEDEQRVFTAAFGEATTADLAQRYEGYRTGMLAAAAVQYSVGRIDGWSEQPIDVDMDTRYAVDARYISPNNAVFLLQIKGHSSPATQRLSWEIIRQDKPPHVDDKTARFWQGIDTYMNHHQQTRPTDARAVFLEVGMHDIDQITGIPSETLDQEIASALTEVDENDNAGW